MSSLTVSILILAALALFAVLAVNLLQGFVRRRREAAARSRVGSRRPAAEGTADEGESDADEASPSAPASRPGPPTRTSRREPRLEMTGLSDADVPVRGVSRDGRATPLAEIPNPAAEGLAPALAQTRSSAPAPVAAPQPAPPVLSPLCDCIVVLRFDAPLPGERLIAATQGVRRAGGKPILCDGVLAGAPGETRVAPLAAGVGYRALRVGVLMANRHGPLNAMEYSEFVASVQSIADLLATLADTPDMAEVIARARDLDATCAQLDAQIGLNVESPEPLGPSEVAALAAEFGLADRGGHRYARLGPLGELVFTMALTDSPQRLGFLLDVPRTAQQLEGWSAMIDCAQDAAARLGGRVVDDAGQSIPLESLDTIARQLNQRYASLEAIGIPAGSPLALRVFN
ncbi:MAG: cell division protein ZipA C-terminal FtsZ-binding domain-containing protein [Burkholderiaceae bacterium]